MATIISALLVVGGASADKGFTEGCSFSLPSGDHYNIDGLSRAGMEWRIPDDDGGNYTYFWNGCIGPQEHRGPGQPTSGGCQGPDGADPDAACQYDPHELLDVFYGLGKLSQQTVSETRPGFLTIKYAGGSLPPSGPPARTMTVEIECDRSADVPVFDVRTPQLPAVNFVLRVKSVHGCVVPGPAPGPAPPPAPPPSPPPGGPGSIEAVCHFQRTTQDVEGAGLTSGVMYMTYTPGVGTATDVFTTGMTPGACHHRIFPTTAEFCTLSHFLTVSCRCQVCTASIFMISETSQTPRRAPALARTTTPSMKSTAAIRRPPARTPRKLARWVTWAT